MSIKHYMKYDEPEEIIDDMTDKEVEIQKLKSELAQIKDTENLEAVQQVNTDKMAALKAKNQAKQQEGKVASKIVAKKERSLALGVLGSGQAGSRIAESFYKLGYDAIVVNTAMQDLKFIDIPDSNKLLLEYGLGGAAKEIEIGRAAAEAHRGSVLDLVNDKLGNSQVNLLCLSLGGGSGAGSCETLVDLLSELGKPLVVITVLPMDTEDGQTKSNALETLSKLAKLTQSKKVNNLIVVDNAKIEAILHNVSQVDFYSTANKAIVDPIDTFNTLSSMPSSTKALDPMEWSKLFIDGEGLSVYGEFSVDNYQEDTAIAEAVINNLSGNLLAEGFDLKQSKYVGFIIAANKTVWSKIPASSVNYASSMINDLCGNPKGVFKGMYVIDSPDDTVKVFSMFTGLGLPAARIDQLKSETKELQSKVKNKDESRNLTLQLDTGTSETVSAAQKIKEKIAQKSSAFGKLMGGVVDRRR
jgi:cell division GTPase FtsZ